jgi:hypothetical protein
METSPKPRDRSNSPAPAPKKKKTPQEQIEEANTRLQELRQEVENFSGTSSDKQYRYLDEMLTRLLISLDNVDTEGNEQLRISRKETVRSIQQCADVLESKGKAIHHMDDQPAEGMSQAEPEAPASDPTDSTPEQEGQETAVPAAAAEPPNPQQVDEQSEQMETEPSACDNNVVADENPIPTASSDMSAVPAEAETCSNESHL